MNVPAFVAEVRRAGIQLWAKDGSLRWRAPEGAMTTEVRERFVVYNNMSQEVYPS